jgi:hypothetical protein
MWATGQSGGAPERSCSLSGAPSGACSDFCARSCTVHCRLLQTTVGAVSRCSAGTPDSPVNYSRVASQFPEGGKFGVDLPGAPDTVRCARPGQPSVVFCSFYLRQTRAAFGCLLLFLFELFLELFIGLC